MKDPYKVLEVSKTASAEDIKRSYRKLAKELHPDLNPGNEKAAARFSDVSQAYDLLSDPDKRKRFDAGEIDASGQETAPRGGFYQAYTHAGGRGKYHGPEFGGDFAAEDIFADLFGGRGQRGGRRRKGADVSYTARITFLEAALGDKKRLQLADGKTLDVNIPPGSETGQTLRLKGQGMPGAGGAGAGDAYIELNVDPHPFFTREGRNIHLELPITLQEAVLGGSVSVPTIHGRLSVKVPAGSNSGKTLRLKGKGISGAKSGAAGDQYVKLKVVLPDKVDDDLRDFVEGWAENHPYDPRAKIGMS